MTSKSVSLELAAICAFFILLAILGAAWDFTSGLLGSGIDGIMLLIICLLILAVFGIMLLVELVGAGILPKPAFGKAKAPAAAKAPAPAQPGK
jgi:hypothetical protein